MSLQYQIHIHFDGENYVARVPELGGCHGVGGSYAQALAAVELAMEAKIFGMVNSGQTVPAPSTNPNEFSPGRVSSRGQPSAVMTLLFEKFGYSSNRELAKKIGLTDESDASLQLSGAASGTGSREVRIAIALALDQLPSVLWPDRQLISKVRDDDRLRAVRSEVQHAP